MIPPRGGTVNQIVNRVKLIWRLWTDRRVNPLLKVLPLASLAYLVMPADLVPEIALPLIGVLDDAAILWLGSYLFVELCPPDVVQEHTKALGDDAAQARGDDVVNGEATDVTEENK
jgi:uncharacterized membrane protein YkvA (DUF1232 family)